MVQCANEWLIQAIIGLASCQYDNIIVWSDFIQGVQTANDILRTDC